MDQKTLLVTGGAGFIGANYIYRCLQDRPGWTVINLDALTYAGNAANFMDMPKALASRHALVRGDIRDTFLLRTLFKEHAFEAVVHFAAESHVDRSIATPLSFVETNVLGTCTLLEAAREDWEKRGRPQSFRLVHVSTDEVFGSLGETGLFSETTPYDPSSPYSASKAASDHFIRAYHRTYGFPGIVTNCSNNFGPFQFPEKLIPLMILQIMEEKSLPVYGDGLNVRDWLYVEDHCSALMTILERGKPGQTYNIGGGQELTNIEVMKALCKIMDQRLGLPASRSSEKLITFVPDRPGHDRRYAMDSSKLQQELGWTPGYSFTQALESTVDWYLSHREWVDMVRSGEYRDWMANQYRI